MPQPQSQSAGDLEMGNVRDDYLDPLSTQNRPSQGESIFGDSSWPLFSMYSTAKEKKDNKIAESLQRDGDGVLIFAGLFSASVAAFLAVTIQDLRPNSQDTSAFYLGNIYEVLADPNVTRAPTSSPVATPPPFSPPRYSVWVNSLWSLSFVLSLICALWAMSVQQWARQYIRVTQSAGSSPEKRARTRAYFSDAGYNVEVSHGIIRILPALLHLSLFLFFVGLGIFLFNINHAVFGSAIWSVLAFVYYDAIFRVWSSRPFTYSVEEKVSKRSLQLDSDILEWSIQAWDDDTLEKVFEAIPGFFNSKLVKFPEDFPSKDILNRISNTLNGFLCRNLSYNITESAKSHRLKICMKAMDVIGSCVSKSCYDILVEGWDQVPPIAEMVAGQLLTYCTSDREHTAHYAQCIVAKILASMPEHDDRWIQFATGAFGLSERDLRNDDNNGVSFSIFIHLFRQSIRHRFYDWDALMAFSELDVRNTLPGLQHDFCTLWNELVQGWQEAGYQEYYGIPYRVLRRIRHLYIALHRGTDAALTDSADEISLYPLCKIASHCPDSTGHVLVPDSRPASLLSQPGNFHGGTIVPQEAEQVNVVVGSPSPSHPMTISGVGGTSRAPIVAPLISLVHSSPADVGHIPSTVPRPVPARASPTSNAPLLVPSVVGSSTPASLPPSHDPPFPHAESLALLSSTTSPSRLTNNALRVRARGLVNTGGMCFANAVLQILLHSPPFWNLFRELRDLKRKQGAEGPETSGVATPLVDSTVRFLEEFAFKEKETPPTQQPLQQTAGVEPGEDEAEKKEVDSFKPTYLYGAMKRKWQLKLFLDTQQQDAEKFFRLYLNALDGELLALLPSIRTHKPASAAPGIDEREVSQSGLTEVGKRGFMAKLVETPITRIFGGKSRLTVRAPNWPDTVTVEDWQSLQLDIQPDSVLTIQDSLVHISHPQPVQIGRPNSTKASRQVQIEVLPPVLVLHLKRFLYDATAEGIVKISKVVQLSPVLKIPPEIMAPVSRKSAEPARYKLYGVVYHRGVSADSGHYTVDVLHLNGDSDGGETWLHIDDEAVRTVRDKDVFGDHDNDERCAYMLFYRRTSPTET